MFVAQIGFNTAPFWTVILGFLILGTSVTQFDIMCICGCFLGVVTLVLAKDDNQMHESQEIDKALSHNLVNKDVTLKQYQFALVCVFITAVCYSFVGVITRYLREIHFSLMMFHYGWIASLILWIYMVCI